MKLTAATPRYQRVKDHLLDRIARGHWRAGDRVPSENELTRQLGVSRMTANRAVRELAADGYLVRVSGVGTFVADRTPHGHLVEVRNIAQEIRDRGHRHRARVIAHQQVPATKSLAREMSLAPGTPVFHSRVVHLENDLPIQVEDRHVNPAIAPDYLDLDLGRRTAYEHLMEVAPLQEAEHVVRAILPVKHIARLLDMAPREPCLLLHRRTWTDGRVASIVDLYHPGTRYELSDRFKP